MRKQKRNVDVVFCVDGSKSMNIFLEQFKNNSMNLPEQIKETMENMGSEIDTIRIKFILFKNTDANALYETPFFDLEEKNEFKNHLDLLTAGGEEGKQKGLKALFEAMKSNFTTETNDRQIIVLVTKNDALPFEEEIELVKTWSCLSQLCDLKLREKNKKLFLFAPIDSKYQELNCKLNKSLFLPIKMYNDSKDIYDDIIKVIGASVANV